MRGSELHQLLEDAVRGGIVSLWVEGVGPIEGRPLVLLTDEQRELLRQARESLYEFCASLAGEGYRMKLSENGIRLYRPGADAPCRRISRLALHRSDPDEAPGLGPPRTRRGDHDRNGDVDDG